MKDRLKIILIEILYLSKILKKKTIFTDALRNIQYRDTFYTKIPRALRFNDRISMKYSIELKENHFLIIICLNFHFNKNPLLKLENVQKWILRDILKDIMPDYRFKLLNSDYKLLEREWKKDL